MSAIKESIEKCEELVARIQNLDGFRASDTMVDYVLTKGKELFSTPLDQQSPDDLIRTGGKLTGAYAYLGQKMAYAKAEHLVYEQKASEFEKEKLLELIHNGVKVTDARSMVSIEMVDLMDFVIQKKATSNQWENITEATEKMISFIQSAIKVKEGERFQTKLQGQG